MTTVASVAWPQLGATGLLAVVIGLILMGRLVPRATLRDAQEQRDKWEAAWRESSAAVKELSGQVAELTEIGHTTTALLGSITREPGQPAGRGGS